MNFCQDNPTLNLITVRNLRTSTLTDTFLNPGVIVTFGAASSLRTGHVPGNGFIQIQERQNCKAIDSPRYKFSR